MTRRNKNIRKSCDDLQGIAKLLMTSKGKVNYKLAGEMIYTIAHKIKRTTWRGKENKYIANKNIKCFFVDNDTYKRINTNQTTTANVDVSTIPYY